MTECVLGVLLLLTILEEEPHKAACVGTVSILSALHYLLCSSLDGMLYYLSAAAFDVAGLAVLCNFAKISKISDRMIYILLAFTGVNFAGFLMWWLYYPPTIYNLSCVALYLLTIYFSLTGKGQMKLIAAIITFSALILQALFFVWIRARRKKRC